MGVTDPVFVISEFKVIKTQHICPTINYLNSLKIIKCSFDYISFIGFANNHVSFNRECKFLGVTLDDRLNFSLHCKSTCSKLSKTLGILYRIQGSVPQRVLVMLYYSLFYPHLIS